MRCGRCVEPSWTCGIRLGGGPLRGEGLWHRFRRAATVGEPLRLLIVEVVLCATAAGGIGWNERLGER